MTEKKISKKQEKSIAREKQTREAMQDVQGVSGQRLKSFIERVERLEEEKKGLGEDIRDVYSEAKSTGFEPKIMRKLVSRRKQNVEKRREEDELLDLYACAIGMSE